MRDTSHRLLPTLLVTSLVTSLVLTIPSLCSLNDDRNPINLDRIMREKPQDYEETLQDPSLPMQFNRPIIRGDKNLKGWRIFFNF